MSTILVAFFLYFFCDRILAMVADHSACLEQRLAGYEIL